MKTIILSFMITSFFSLTMAQNSDKTFNLLVGTYTNKAKTNGIHVYRFNAETGEFAEKSKAVNIINPSYLAISKDRKNVYAVSEAGNGNSTVNAFSFEPKSGALVFLNSVTSGGSGPCYVSADDKKQFVFAGNYNAGSLSAIRVNKDGSLSGDIQTIQHEGGSIDKERQDKPHVHSVVLSPDNHYLLTPDLGTDKINVYRFDPLKPQSLSPAEPPFAKAKDGSGPRHLTFHPNGKFAYLILEMEGAIAAFDYQNGKLESKQSITMLSPGFTGDVGAADIHVSPDGKFLYGSNRGDANEVVIYAIGKDGKLTYAGRESSKIKTPRNFAIDPTGNFLLVANQDSDDIVIFRRDQKTGLLTPTGQKISVDKPVCLQFTTEK